MTLTTKRRSRSGKQPCIWSNYLSDCLTIFTYEMNTSGPKNGVTYYQESESMLWGSQEITVLSYSRVFVIIAFCH